VKQLIKRILKRVAPAQFDVIQAIRARRYCVRLQTEWGLTDLDQQFIAAHGHMVRHGPFEGMQLASQKLSGGLIPRALGSYEAELHPALHRLLQMPYAIVVDVGCAEGYYAVGLARKLPGAIVYAFDIDPAARRVCRTMAKLNDVHGRVVVRGRCGHQSLRAVLRPKSLIVCDCEGYEFTLLSTEHVPELKLADLLVELHDAIDSPNVTNLIQRFAPTHSAELFSTQPRNPSEFAELAMLPESDRARAIAEVRMTGQHWLLLTAAAPS